MANIKLVVAYDGTRYLGWQKTKTGLSIEESLEKALSQILQENVSLQAASRTDAGVHAEGQVVNFITKNLEIDLPLLQKELTPFCQRTFPFSQYKKKAKPFIPPLTAWEKNITTIFAMMRRKFLSFVIILGTFPTP